MSWVKHSQRLFVAIGFLCLGLCDSMPAFADNVGCMPVTGQFTAVAEQQKINSALLALRNNNAGSTQPSDDCSGAPVKGQFWLNTASTPNTLEMWDGAQWDVVGHFDPINGLWLPVQAGGLATMTSATVTDLCAGVPQNEITLSGTTPITSFGSSCQVGQFKFLKFTDKTPIVYNAGSILTPNGQSITTENGGRGIVVYLGAGVWDLMFYHSTGMDVPAGSIQIMTSPTPDPGYLLADGQTLSTTAYPNLFAKIGYLFGGSGSTFNLPDLRGRYLAGLDNMGGAAANRITNFNADNIGNIGGAQSYAIAQANFPNVNFPMSLSYSASGSTNSLEWSGNAEGQIASYTGGAYNGPSYPPQNTFIAPTVNINLSISATVNSGGSGTPLQTLPPTEIVAYEIKY